jgi:hypothetical protein
MVRERRRIQFSQVWVTILRPACPPSCGSTSEVEGLLPPPAGADSDLKLRRDASRWRGLLNSGLVVTGVRRSPGGPSGLEQSLWLSPGFHGFSLGSRHPHSRALGEFVADQLPTTPARTTDVPLTA